MKITLDKIYIETGESDVSISKAIGIAQSTIWRVRTGRHVPRLETAERISNAVGNLISATDIMKQAYELLKERQQ